MNKDLVKRCDSIIKNCVVNSAINYNTLIKELDKNKHYRTDGQHNNAVQYLCEHNVIIIERKKVSRKNFTSDELEFLKSIIKIAKDDNNIIERSMINIYFTDEFKSLVAYRYLSEQGYTIIEDEISNEDTDYNDYNENELDLISDDISDINELDEYLTDDLEDITEDENKSKVNNYEYDPNILVIDSVKQYFNEISKYPLLSVEEERKLTKAYKETKDENIRLKLICHNLRLPVSIAKYYAPKCDMELQDLIQYGNIGLLSAIDRFDPARNLRISTYATLWIRQAILRGIGNDNRTIRMPIHASEQAHKNRKSKYILEKELGRPCTEDELLDYINTNKLYVTSINYISREMLRLFEAAYENSKVSIYTPIGEDEDSELIEFIEAPNVATDIAAEMGLVKDILTETIEKTLNEREQAVIKLRFGMNNAGRCYTLQDVAVQFGVTRERIRQIECKAIRKLRNPKVKRILKDLLETGY